MSDKDPRNFTFKGKSFDEWTQEDIDELRYTRGEHLRSIVEHKEELEGNEIDRKVKFNNNLKKQWEKEFNEEVKELRDWMRRIDERIQAILDEYAWNEQMDLKDAKEQIKEAQERRKVQFDSVASANAKLLSYLHETQDYIANAEEQAELLQWLADEREKVLAKQDTEDTSTLEADSNLARLVANAKTKRAKQGGK